MTFPLPGGRFTAGYHQPRPLASETPTHVHGAIDVAAPVGTPVLAPEAGRLHYFAAFREDRSRKMGELDLSRFPFQFLGRPYFYDTYGGVAILFGKSGWTHLFAHHFLNQLFNTPPHRMRWHYEESAHLERWPAIAFFTTNGAGHYVREGDTITYVGTAGYSTGPHIHYEIHRTGRWTPHDQRPNPEDIFDVKEVTNE